MRWRLSEAVVFVADNVVAAAWVARLLVEVRTAAAAVAIEAQ